MGLRELNDVCSLKLHMEERQTVCTIDNKAIAWSEFDKSQLGQGAMRPWLTNS